MADTVTTQVYNGEHNYVVTIENVSDGTGQSNVVIVNASTITSGVITKLVLWKCSYNIKAGSVTISWDDTARRQLLFMSDAVPGMTHRDFSEFGGLSNSASSLFDSTGNVLLTTNGFGVTSGYSITLEFKKVGVRDILPPSLDLNFETNIAWDGSAIVTPASLLTVTRASVGYADNIAGTWTNFLANVARITDKGLLVEEVRTNGVPNNSTTGAVGGSPGTLPTGITITLPTGLTRTITLGSTSGIEWVDLNYAGTASSTAQLIIRQTTIASSPAAVSGQIWTNSAWISNSSTTGTTTLTLSIIAYDAANAATENQATSVFGQAWQRSQLTRTLSGGTTTKINHAIVTSNITNTTVVNFTIRIGWPQSEQGEYASSPIRTTVAAAARAADVVTVTTPPILSRILSLFGKATPQAPATYLGNQFISAISDGTTANRFGLDRLAATATPNWSLDLVQTEISASAWTQNVSRKIAATYLTADQAGSFNGSAAVSANSTVTLTGLNRIEVGGNGASLLQFNGYVERITLWPSRLSNDNLQTITI